MYQICNLTPQFSSKLQKSDWDIPLSTSLTSIHPFRHGNIAHYQLSSICGYLYNIWTQSISQANIPEEICQEIHRKSQFMHHSHYTTSQRPYNDDIYHSDNTILILRLYMCLGFWPCASNPFEWMVWMALDDLPGISLLPSNLREWSSDYLMNTIARFAK